MFSALLITLREGLEAALVVGIVLAIIRQTGLGVRTRQVWWGVGAAIVASLVVGAALTLTGRELQGTAEAIFEGAAALLAVGVLTWMIFWMRRQAATEAGELRLKTSAALAGGGAALFWIAFVAVGREGVETALFLFAANSTARPLATLAGATIGLVLAAGLGVAIYRGTSRLNLRTFFTVSSVLLIGFAAYLLTISLHELGEILGSELLEEGGLVAGALYAITALWLFMRPPTWLQPRSLDATAAPTAA